MRILNLSFFRILLVVFCFCLFDSFGQQVLVGKVLDASNKQVISNASVSLMDSTKTKIRKFSLTDEKGNFSLNLGNRAATDSLILKISCLNFETILLKTTLQAEHSYFLNPKTTELEQIIVKTKPLERLSDTLIYSADGLKSRSDEYVVDILKKIPGVSINESGAIKYNGMPINKFYVEGLDLMGGRYGQIVNQLGVESVSKVKVYENHQPIKNLNGVEYSERAAIDIQLKKGTALAGSLKLGLSPNLSHKNLDVSPMLFKKNIQFFNRLFYDNIGQIMPRDFKEVDYENLSENSLLDPFTNSLLHIGRVPSAFRLNQSLLRFNKSYGNSFNVLKKIGDNGLELKANVLLGDFTNTFLNTSVLRYQTERGNIQLENSQTNKVRNKDFLANLDVSKNTKKVYIKNRLSLKNAQENSLGEATESNLALGLNELRNPYFHISNVLNSSFRLQKNLNIKIYSNFQMGDFEQSLITMPNSLLKVDSLKEFLQMYSTKGHLYLNSIAFLKIYKKLKFETKVLNLHDKKDFDSRILANGFQITDPRFLNSFTWKKQTSEVSESIFYDKSNFIFEGHIGLRNYSVSITEAKIEEKNEKYRLEPSVRLHTKFPSKLNYTISANVTNRYGTVDQVYKGLIVQSINYASSNTGEIGFNSFKNISFGFKYVDYTKFFNCSLNLSIDKIDQELISSSIIDENGYIRNTQLPMPNVVNSNLLIFDLSKFLLKQRLSVKFNSFFMRSERLMSFNDAFNLIKSQNSVSELAVSKDFKKIISLAYNLKARYSSNLNTSNSVTSNFINFDNSLHLLLSFKNSYKLDVNANSQLGISGKVNQNLVLANMKLSVPLKNRSFEIDFSWNNIFNQKELIVYDISPTLLSLIKYPIRPSFALVTLKYKFKSK